MWILPNQIAKQYSASVLDSLELKEESKELLDRFELRLMWKSKPLLSGTFSMVWKRGWWLRHLFGQTLKHSRTDDFVIRYTESLPDIHANLLAMRGNEKAPMILDTCGLIYEESKSQLDLFGRSTKTWRDTLRSDLRKYQEIFGGWVTSLRQESTQRKKLARHIKENESSFLQWGTPTALSRPRNEDTLMKCLDFRQGNGQNSVPLYLEEQVMMGKSNWGTPRVTTNGGRGSLDNPEQSRLEDQVLKSFPTPNATMVQKYGANKHQNDLEVMARSGQLVQGPNTNGKNPGQLNPAWVAQLMGTTLEKTFFACTETELCRKPLSSPGAISGENTTKTLNEPAGSINDEF